MNTVTAIPVARPSTRLISLLRLPRLVVPRAVSTVRHGRIDIPSFSRRCRCHSEIARPLDCKHKTKATYLSVSERLRARRGRRDDTKHAKYYTRACYVQIYRDFRVRSYGMGRGCSVVILEQTKINVSSAIGQRWTTTLLLSMCTVHN